MSFRKTSIRVIAILLSVLVAMSVFATVFIYAEEPDESTQEAAKVAALTVESSPADTDLRDGENSTEITYTIKNTGEAQITDIVLKDSDIAGSKTIGTLDSLEPGSSKTFNYTASFTRSSTSSPVVTCKAEGESKTFTGASVQIKYQEGSGAKLTATLKADKTNVTADEDVNFTLTITNAGSSAVKDIIITSGSGTQLKSGVSVGANDSTTVEFTSKIEQSGNFSVNIEGEDAAGGEVSLASEAVNITVDGQESEATDPILINVEADKYQLEEAGDVNLTISIENTTDQAYSEIVITDQVSNSELQKIDTLDPRQTRTLTTTVKVEKNTSFEYKLVAIDANGEEISVQSNKIDVEVAGGNFSWLTAIIVAIVVIVVLIIAAGVTLFVLSKKEKKKNKELGSQYSKKYMDPTPKRSNVEERPRPKMSTFTIDENAQGEENAIENEETFPIPPQSGFADEEFIELPEDSELNTFADLAENDQVEIPNSVQETVFENDFDDNPVVNEFESKFEKSQNTPMDFNDLDPDNF